MSDLALVYERERLLEEDNLSYVDPSSSSEVLFLAPEGVGAGEAISKTKARRIRRKKAKALNASLASSLQNTDGKRLRSADVSLMETDLSSVQGDSSTPIVCHGKRSKLCDALPVALTGDRMRITRGSGSSVTVANCPPATSVCSVAEVSNLDFRPSTSKGTVPATIGCPLNSNKVNIREADKCSIHPLPDTGCPPTLSKGSSVVANVQDDSQITTRRTGCKPSYREAATMSLNAVIGKAGADRQMNEDDLTHCRSFINREALSAGVVANTRGCWVHNGTIVVKCSSQVNLHWLTTVVAKIPPKGGTKFMVYQDSVSTKLTRLKCTIKDTSLRSALILSALRTQNPGIDTRGWRIYTLKRVRNRDNLEVLLLVVGVDSSSLDILRSRYNYTLNLSIEVVTFRSYQKDRKTE